MRQLKAHGLALLAICALGLVTSQAALALALPEITLLAGEKFPVLGILESRVDPNAIKFESEFGVQVFAEQVKATFEVSSAGPSALVALKFVNVRDGKAKCRSEGEEEGHVTLKGELRLVPVSKEEPSQLGGLFAFTERTLLCIEGGKEVANMKIKPPLLIKVVATVATKGEEIATFGLTSKCSGKGKQELSTYLDDEEKSVEKQLVEFGGGKGCVEFKEELVMKLNKKILMPAILLTTSLPYIQLLPASESYPFSLTGSTIGGEIKLESVEKLGATSSAAQFTLEVPKAGLSGPITLQLTGTKEKTFGTSCSTEGASAGTVVINGEYHLVYTSLSPLTVGILISFPELFVNCTVKYKMKGPLLLGVKVKLLENVTSFGLTAKCSGVGKQELTSFFTSTKTLAEKQLLMWSKGGEFESVCFSTSVEAAPSGEKKFLING